MEASYIRCAVLAATLLSLGASYRTENFIVTAGDDQLARAVATAAETYRRDLAIEWLGQELPGWRDKCPIRVNAGPNLGAGGVTQFMFEGRQPIGWSMTIQGTPERILDSVLPHEITHTIFATHFGRPLPRWADEGACTTVEHEVERRKQHRLLYEFLTTGRGIAFNQMFAMTEYPPDVLPLYSQGYSLARFFIAQGGKQKFVKYVGDGMNTNNWPAVTRQYYGYRDLSELQVTWLEWVRQGSGPLPNTDTQIAQADRLNGVSADIATEPNAALSSTPPAAMASLQASPTTLAASSPTRGATALNDSASVTVSPLTGQLLSADAAASGPLSRPLPANAQPGTQGPVANLATAVPTAAQNGAVSLASNSTPRSATHGGSGWYARVRDQASRDASQARRAQNLTTPTTPPVTQRTPRGTPVARPQVTQQAEQVVLEWSRSSPPPAAVNPADSAPTSRSGAAQSYLLSSEQFRQSVLR
jgi:hypothetical protein